jgi:hypothetical protein
MKPVRQTSKNKRENGWVCRIGDRKAAILLAAILWGEADRSFSAE